MYRLAARALEGLEKKKGSLKAIAFAVNREKGKKIYALAVETLKRYGAIRRVIEECQLILDTVNDSENEDVVKCALEKVNSRFELEHILPEWPIRGITSFPQAVCCVRTDPELNHTNGFFVALFRRTVKAGSDCKVDNLADKSRKRKATLDGSLKRVSKSRISKKYKRRKLKLSMRTYYIVPLTRSRRYTTTLWTHSHLLMSKCRHW